MDAIKKLFSHYMISSMVILLVFLLVNGGLLYGALTLISSHPNDSSTSIDDIAALIEVDEQWQVTAEPQALSRLTEKQAWAMILDNDGTVIWNHLMPTELASHYSASDVAAFSRWYLDDYPIVLHTLDKGLLVVGYQPNSVVKLNYTLNRANIKRIIAVGAFMALSNILLLFFLLWLNIRKIDKTITPILNGIIEITKGLPVSLSETTPLSDIKVEINQASKMMLKKDKARADWITGISHDVRTPLSVMLGYAGEIEDNQALPLSARQKAQIIRRQGEKLRQLIIDLNLTSKLEYASQPLTIARLYPVELARQVITDLLNNRDTANYVIDFDASSDLDHLFLEGDWMLLSRMLDNLVQNCLTHNPEGCQINVSVTKTNTTWQYTISDNGAGLTEEQMEDFNTHLFSDTHYLANDETAHGFGLQLVSQIVAAHHGKIRFQQADQGGLMVSVIFPFNNGTFR